MADSEMREEGYTGRSGVKGRDWTKGSILRNLLLLSWPIIITNGSRIIGPTIDLLWVGRLGAASIAGVGISSMAVHAVMAGRMGISTGVRAMIARSIGAGDAEGANHIAQQGLVISAAYGIIMAVIGIFFAEQILGLFGVEADVVREGAAYMRIAFAGSAAMSFLQLTENLMQASGDSVTPMRISIIYRLFHVGFVPFLIFGWWIFPRLGVSGAALAGVISNGLGMVLGLWILFTGRSRLRLTLRGFNLDFTILRRIIRIGVPSAVMMSERSFSRLLLTWFMTPFGTYAVAAHTLIERIVRLITMSGIGLGRGAAVLVGQNLGAQQPERAEKSAWLAVGFAEGIMVVFSVAVLLWPGSLIRIFNSEPGLVELTSVFLRIGVVGYSVYSIDQILQLCLGGAGDTLPPMLITLLSLWVVLMPLAFFLSRFTDLGVYGVRWAMVIGIITGVIAYVTYFRMGRWKYKRIL
ncbi:MATE family efflux transporter [Chloroflexota bacterium]